MMMNVMARRNWWAMALVAVAAVLALVMVFGVRSASAENGTFDLTVRHGINGRSLGLEKDLPVDVYVNDGEEPAFSFKFKDRIQLTLPAGVYKIDVTLAGEEDVIMSLEPTNIPAGVDVDIKAKLSANKTPVLKVKVK